MVASYYAMTGDTCHQGAMVPAIIKHLQAGGPFDVTSVLLYAENLE